MRSVLAIARREFGAYMGSPIGWIIACGFVIMWGFFFTVMLVAYADASQQAVMYGEDSMNVNDMLIAPMFGNMSVIALLISPALTMRLIAEDRKSRSIELLLTSPVSSAQIVLGKFLGSIYYTGVLGAFTLLYAGILAWLGDPDFAVLASNYVAFFLMFGSFLAAGMFFSSLTENQVVALLLAFSFNLIFWVIGWAAQGADEGTLKTVFEYLSTLNHIESMSKGVIHVKDVVYFLTSIGFFLFASAQRVEALRWR